MQMKMPLQIKNVQISGISINAVDQGGSAQILTRAITFSMDDFFHGAMADLERVIGSRLLEEGYQVNLGDCNDILIIIHKDYNGNVWIKNIPRTMTAKFSKDLNAGDPVFEDDLIDIIGINFHEIAIKKDDQIIYVFRVGWRFCLFFDFNPNSSIDIEKMSKDLADAYRKLRYYKLYEGLESKDILSSVINAGWFPFIEIIGHEYERIASVFSYGLSLPQAEEYVLSKFTNERLENIYARWLRNPIVAPKQKMFRSAIDGFKREDPYSTIKIILTEIEGIISAAYRGETKSGPINNVQMIKFLTDRVSTNAGKNNTLYFPKYFGRYLRECTYKEFTPGINSSANSRHAVGHGIVNSEEYTPIRSLQTILTLDQIIYYLG